MKIKSVYFPRKMMELTTSFHRYYDIHIAFVRNVLAETTRIQYYDISDQHPRHETKFETTINDRSVMFDFSDFTELLPSTDLEAFDGVFKFHYNSKEHAQYPRVHAFSPVSFHDWAQFRDLKNSLHYRCSGRILNNQFVRQSSGVRRFYERRDRVQRALIAHYGTEVDTELTDQASFFAKIDNCLISVCVPGMRANMLDRGQLQFMGFGVCTVSPRLVCELPFQLSPEPDVHYVRCDDDYSNLFEIIEWCRANREHCINIGMNAKKLFAAACTPPRLADWIETCLFGS